MLRAMLNRATMRVADTTEVSGRVTAESIKHGLFAKKQSAPPMKRLFACFLLTAGAMLLSVASYGQIAINSVPAQSLVPGTTHTYSSSLGQEVVNLVAVDAS